MKVSNVHEFSRTPESGFFGQNSGFSKNVSESTCYGEFLGVKSFFLIWIVIYGISIACSGLFKYASASALLIFDEAKQNKIL